jgi:hypothetical protein
MSRTPNFGDVGTAYALPMSRTPNFGDVGTAYAFVEESTWEGRFLWQCH